MKRNLKAIKLAGATPELDMFWVDKWDGVKNVGEFEPPKLFTPSLYLSPSEVDQAYCMATDSISCESVEIVTMTLAEFKAL